MIEKWKRGGLSPGQKKKSFFRAPYYHGFDFFALFRVGISDFRIMTLLSQILNSTSDPRQDGQLFSFTATERGTEELLYCRRWGSPLSWSISACSHCCLPFKSQEKPRWVVLIVVRFKIVASGRGIYIAYRSCRAATTLAMWQGYTGCLPLGGGRCKGAVSQPCHEQ